MTIASNILAGSTTSTLIFPLSKGMRCKTIDPDYSVKKEVKESLKKHGLFGAIRSQSKQIAVAALIRSPISSGIFGATVYPAKKFTNMIQTKSQQPKVACTIQQEQSINNMVIGLGC